MYIYLYSRIYIYIFNTHVNADKYHFFVVPNSKVVQSRLNLDIKGQVVSLAVDMIVSLNFPNEMAIE